MLLHECLHSRAPAGPPQRTRSRPLGPLKAASQCRSPPGPHPTHQDTCRSSFPSCAEFHLSHPLPPPPTSTSPSLEPQKWPCTGPPLGSTWARGPLQIIRQLGALPWLRCAESQAHVFSQRVTYEPATHIGCCLPSPTHAHVQTHACALAGTQAHYCASYTSQFCGLASPSTWHRA